MRWKDYWYLGKISTRSRKKSTRNTVVGFSFGLIMLVPVLFFSFSFYLDLTAAINSTHNISSFYVTTVHEKEQKDGMVGDSIVGDETSLLGKTERDKLQSKVGSDIKEIIRQEYFYISSPQNKFYLNGQEIFFLNETGEFGNQNEVNESIKIIGNGDGCGHIVPNGYIEDLKKKGKSFLIAGEGFSESEKGEILVSERFAYRYGKTPQELLGKKLTLTTQVSNSKGDTFIDNDNDPDNVFSESTIEETYQSEYFRDFKIVGVISEDYYLLNERVKNDSHLWISGKSYYSETDVFEGKYLPYIRINVSEQNGYTSITRVVTYPEGFRSMRDAAIKDGMFFPSIPGGEYYSPYQQNVRLEDGLLRNAVSYTVQCKDYKSAKRTATILDAGYKRLGMDYFTGQEAYCTSAYQKFLLLDQVGSYMVTALCVFGGIIFFATLLNLYNSVQYSVQARRHYLGMMRAIGAQQSVLRRLYFVEILILFRKCILWVLIFGGGISYLIKFLVDMAFADSTWVYGVVIRLNFWYFGLAFAIALGLCFLIAYLFSRIACIGVTRKPILEILIEDK